jgi:alpha-beta hydrolase superfamily lysophospholipase
MPSTTTDLVARDGTRLVTRHWVPGGEPWAAMLIVHGAAEHSGRYERTGGLVAASGVDSHALDLRGHGGSGGTRGDVERWSDFLDDIELALGKVRQSQPALPLVLLGHSMGGLLCLDYATAGRPAPDLLVLCSPGLGDRLPAWQHAMVPILARVSPRAVVPNAWRSGVLSRDPEVGRAIDADPLVLTGLTMRLGAEGFAAQKRVSSAIDRLTIPTYVVHGGDDRFVPSEVSAPLERLPVVTRVVVPGLRHETLNEPEGPEVVAGIVAWLRERTTGDRP